MLNVVLIGPAAEHELVIPRAALRNAFARSEIALQEFNSLEECFSNKFSEDSPVDLSSADLICCYQAHPTAIDGQRIIELQNRLPLARWLLITGAWSEGETRSGKPLSGMLRVAAAAFPAFWHSQLARLQLGQQPDWLLPLTASFEERIQHVPADSKGRGRITIVTPDAERYASLADCMERAGYEAVWQRDAAKPATFQPDLIIWSGLPPYWDERDDALPVCTNGPPIIALLTFPRHDQIQQLLERGISAVLPLPLLIEDLLATVQATLAAANSTARR